MFFWTFRWHLFGNRTKIERFIIFFKPISNKKNGRWNLVKWQIEVAHERLWRVWGKKYRSFNFSPRSKGIPPNCLEEHRKHMYMSKNFFGFTRLGGGSLPSEIYERNITTSAGRLPPPNLVNPNIFLDIYMCPWCSPEHLRGIYLAIGQKLSDLYFFFKPISNKKNGGWNLVNWQIEVVHERLWRVWGKK